MRAGTFDAWEAAPVGSTKALMGLHQAAVTYALRGRERHRGSLSPVTPRQFG